VKGSERRRVQGFEDSRGRVGKDRGLEGWRVGRKQKTEDRSQRSEVRRQRVGGLEVSLNIYTSKHLTF